MSSSLETVKDWPELAWKAQWSVMKLARLCAVSTRTLERYFKETYKQTPERWLSEQRWCQAREFLYEGISVKGTAAKLGWKQASTFSREFKKRFGQSPLKFSKQPIIKPLPAFNVA